MAEYIERDALLKKALAEIKEFEGVPINRLRELAEADKDGRVIVTDAPPTVCDMQAVVHCKDCRFLRFSDFYGECGCGLLGIVSPWDYCSHGERNDVKTLANRLMETVGETIDCYLEKGGDDPCGQ